MSIPLEGNWDKGLAFDVHTLASTYLGTDDYGHARYENVRSEMGELVYRLKYQGDKETLPAIVDLLDAIKGIEKFDFIVPIPPSDKSRGYQPVAEIASALGARHGVGVLPKLLEKTAGGAQLKNVTDPDERKRLLLETMRIDQSVALKGRSILLVDDLFRSGATLDVATTLLRQQGAAKVAVLTMTKTRSNR
jgi:predicted amidophosphoribosyltransferase